MLNLSMRGMEALIFSCRCLRRRILPRRQPSSGMVSAQHLLCRVLSGSSRLERIASLSSYHHASARHFSTEEVLQTTTTTTTTTSSSQEAHSTMRKMMVWDDILHPRIESGILQPDAFQERVANLLQKTQLSLEGYDNSDARAYYHHYHFHNHNRRRNPIHQPQPTTNGTKQCGDEDGRMSSHQSQPLEDVDPPPPPPRIPKGYYLWGNVGTGKSLLLDAFFEHVSVTNKRRFHFHEFLHHIHERLYQQKVRFDQQKQNIRIKQEAQQSSVTTRKDDPDNTTVTTKTDSPVPIPSPMETAAHDMASEYHLLYIDEFQILDVADAALLSQILSVMLANGTVLVLTSNRSPSELYEDGLHRNLYVGILEKLLHKHCHVLQFRGTVDYRYYNSENDEQQLLLVEQDEASMFVTQEVPKEKPSTSANSHSDRQQITQDGYPVQRYFVIDPNNHISATKHIDAILKQLCKTAVDKQTIQEVQLDHYRSLPARVYQFDNGKTMARFHFADLCVAERAASDYRVLAHAFDGLVVESIPILTDRNTIQSGHNEARRFITLIDELYQAKRALICTAESPPSELFATSKRDNLSELVEEDVILGIDQVQDSHGHAINELASVRELSFAFRRCASRLVEMTSLKWWKQLMT